MCSLIVIITILFSSVNNFVVYQDTVWYTESGNAEFTSSVPLHTFTGTSSNLTGLLDFEENVIDFYLDLQTIKTGNSRRDRDMYRTLDIDVYPFAEFTGRITSQINPDSEIPQSVTVTGEFTVHGVTNQIEVEGLIYKEGSAYLLEADWVLLISDYEIEPPGILFYRVRDEIEVHISAEMQPVEREALQ